MIYIIGGFLLVGIMMYALIASPKTDEERRMEDEEQMRYLQELAEKKKNKK